MMIESVQHGCGQEVLPDFEALKKLTEDYGQGRALRQEIANNREILRENKRDAEMRKRILRGRLNRRWSRYTAVDNSCSALSLFNLRF